MVCTIIVLLVALGWQEGAKREADSVVCEDGVGWAYD